MKRRDFLKLSAVATASCSIYVRVPAAEPTSLAAQEDKPDAPEMPPGSAWPATFGRMALQRLQCDLFIAGGGMAGVCAAISAARHGQKVVLVQDRSRLGGNSSSEVKMHIVGADMGGGRPGWREGGLIEEFRLEDAVHNPQRSGEMWDLLLYDKIKCEPNITLFLDTVLFAVDTAGGLIRRVLARCDKTEHLYEIHARLYADCTGDCRLGLEAGAEIRREREARSEFGESLALEKPDRHTLGSTILFTSHKTNKAAPFRPPAWARKVTKEMLRFRGIKSWEYGYWWVEWGGAVDTIADNEKIRAELLAISLGVWDYIKNSGEHPSSANWALDWLGMVPGKRGSRRMVGDYILKEQDLMGLAPELPDGVCIGGWSMDDHPPGGFDDDQVRPARQVPPPFAYNIPLRSLYSRNVGNLMMAGRNLSATHVAFTSTRVMATCSVIGQAMGTAAAYCLQHSLLPAALAHNQKHVQALQQTLLRDDQTIRNQKNTDPLDLARTASVTGSETLSDCDPEAVINGFVRDLPGKRDNRWLASLKNGSAWLQLEWKAPVKLTQVQITFDTGFERLLTLSHQDSYTAKMIRAPQPETVKDYELLYRSAASKPWISLAKITGNYQRLRRHNFPAIPVQALKLNVTATNGQSEASVFEVRCYS
jgi:hypothetical protein